MAMHQNALRIKKTGQIIRSSHRHDFQTFQIGAKTHFIDGGLDYKRWTDFPIEEIDDLTILVGESIESAAEKLLWGTRGRDGSEPFKLVFLKDCDVDHLRNIVHDLGEKIPKIYLDVIRYLIKEKTCTVS